MNAPRRLTGLTALLALAALTGCDTAPEITDPDLSGRYVGFGGGYVWTLDLTDTGGALSGSGTVETAETTYPLTVEGAADYPVVGMVLDAEGLGQFTFEGRGSSGGDVLTGTLASGEGFNGEVAFLRERARAASPA